MTVSTSTIKFISILKINIACISLSMSSIIAVVFKVYDLDVFTSLQQSLSFIKELIITDIKDLSVKHDFDSSRSSQQINNISENKYTVQQSTLIKDLTLNSIN